jgi:Mor family transcriptional regulator
MKEAITETSASSVLLQLVGPEIMERISSTFGGEAVYIPRKIREGRDEIIKQEFNDLLSSGATCMSSYHQLAKKHELSPRRIMEIVNHAA